MINLKNNTFSTFIIYLIFLSSFSFTANALPKISTVHETNALGIPQIKVTNETAITLACYVAIDGYKKKFVLQAFKSSKWYMAASNLYVHTNFSTWCDAIEFHPNYNKYR